MKDGCSDAERRNHGTASGEPGAFAAEAFGSTRHGLQSAVCSAGAAALQQLLEQQVGSRKPAAQQTKRANQS